MGVSIGKCPKNKLFRGYIDLEIQLREFDRCRVLYEKFLEFGPENCTTWMKYAELEAILGDKDRARGIYELAINQLKLDMPEVLWKSYIDYEFDQEEYARTRHLYRRLLQRTQHVKVWISFAHFEMSVPVDDALVNARNIYKEAARAMKSAEEREERLMLLESWLDFEKEVGAAASQEAVMKLMPQKIKKRRKIVTEDGSDAGWEEYFDYIFPDEESAQPNLKLLAMAQKWKQMNAMKKDEDNAGNDSPNERTFNKNSSSEEEEDEDEDAA